MKWIVNFETRLGTEVWISIATLKALLSEIVYKTGVYILMGEPNIRKKDIKNIFF